MTSFDFVFLANVFFTIMPLWMAFGKTWRPTTWTRFYINLGVSFANFLCVISYILTSTGIIEVSQTVN